MANTYDSYTDKQIMRALLTKDFSIIGRAFEDDKITAIKAGAFYTAQSLDRVSAKNATRIGEMAFMDSGITSLELDWEKLTFIGSNAFAELSGSMLPEVLNLPKAVTIQNGAFSQASNNTANIVLKSVNAPLWTGEDATSNLVTTTVRGTFSYCTALVSVSAPELVAIPANCFQRCTSLVNISFPKAASYGTTAFTTCSSLVKVRLGGDVRNMNASPFTSCTKLEALVLPGITTTPTINAANWTSTNFGKGTAFFYVPASMVNTLKVTSGWSTFADQIRAIEDYPEICNF